MSVTTELAIKFIKKRSGDIVDFDLDRIKNAIVKAYTACNLNVHEEELEQIVQSVYADLEEKHALLHEHQFITVELTQDLVEQNLIKFNKYDIAKEYILYRAKRNEERQKEHEINVKKFEKETLKVVKMNGKKEDFDMDKIQKVFNYVVK